MLYKKISSLKTLRVKLGTLGVIRYVLIWFIQKLKSYFQGFLGIHKRVDIFEHYKFLKRKDISDSDIPHIVGSDQIINWIIPDVGIGSGGHLNIFRLIMYLEKQGYICRIIIVGGSQFVSGDVARALIRKHFFPINAEVYIGEDGIKPAIATFATSWVTAYFVRNFNETQFKFYFVQDYEPYFYSHGSDYYLAEETYRMGFYGVTAGSWLANKLSNKFSMKTTAMGFSYDHDLYYPRLRKDVKQKRVFFYARPVTARRGFELGLLALAMVAQKYPDVEFVLAGWDCSNYYIPFRHVNAGNIPVPELPVLYSQCDVALVLSLTNLSLLPLELMACGCPVVSNKGDNVEWLLSEDNALLADLTPIGLAQALITLLENEQLRRDIVERGRKFASSTSWEAEAVKISTLMTRVINSKG